MLHTMRKQIMYTVSLIVVLTIGIFISPITAASSEPGNLVSSDVITTSADTYKRWEDPEAFRSEVIRLVNIERESNGLDTLETMQELTDMADIRAKESDYFFSHTRPDGSDCLSIFQEYGVARGIFGENLSRGFSSPTKLVAAWMDSESHRTNILSEKFAHIGIGIYVNGNGKVFCSLLFYAP